jgi:hypothetical protein
VEEAGGFEAAELWKSGIDLTTLWTTPHPSGISTRIQETAIISGEDFGLDWTMVSSRLEADLEIRS